MKAKILIFLLSSVFIAPASDTDVITIPPCPTHGVIRTYVIGGVAIGITEKGFDDYKRGETIDDKPFFIKCGMTFAKDDFAVYVPRQHMLIFGSTEQNHDLLASIIR